MRILQKWRIEREERTVAKRNEQVSGGDTRLVKMQLKSERNQGGVCTLPYAIFTNFYYY